ncbi:class I SAM-dependent methyltransferase [Motiliproteus coralliicola]|nr:class I SAM-dependent methyltransferase [Motiliproteus coralliicola]
MPTSSSSTSPRSTSAQEASLTAAIEAIEGTEFVAGCTEISRLFHGRGHCFDGLEHLNIDWLPPVMLITLYQAESNERLQPLVDKAQVKGVGRVAVQHRYQRGGPIDWLLGEPLTELVVTEQGLKYGLQLGRSQNHGLFLDMANGRQWLRQRAQGARVLNLFAYTCGFSVAAVAGGAQTVVNLDMSKGALKRGQQNHQLNDHDLRGVRFLPHELFRSWGKLRKSGPYDRVVIDPPSFQRGSFVASEDYQRVLRRLPELLLPEAELLVCLNDPTIAPGFLIELMQQHCPKATYVERLANPDSFPEQDPNRALKVLRFHYQAD